MKKFFTFIVISLLFISCGINCKDEPPKRAIFHESGGMEMQYHITLYPPYAMLSHEVGCTEYEYLPIHIYTDELGIVKGDEVIWTNNNGEELPFTENGDKQENITLSLSRDKVEVSGFVNQRDNGIYKVETSSPDSWGIPIS